MCKLVAVTNRRLCRGDFLTQIERLCVGGVDRIILREKDLAEKEYEHLARQVLEVCRAHDTECILHTYLPVAEKLGADGIHLPLAVAFSIENEENGPIVGQNRIHNAARTSIQEQSLQMQEQRCHQLGISVHSLAEALQAERLGATYLTAGHIFPTTCKPDLAPRGLEFLSQIVNHVQIPVYAIGGIDPDNAAKILSQRAAGICIMSGLMNATPEQIRQYINSTHAYV